METLTGKFFEVGIKFEKTKESGLVKKVKENYIVDALTFTEGERNITDEMSSYISGEFEVCKMKPTPFAAILTRECDMEDRFWKCKVAYTVLDERTGAEKKTNETYLVQSLSIMGALQILSEHMKPCLGDWEIVAIQETNFLAVFQYGRGKQEFDS